jgi:hypothetical protein
VLGAVTPRCLVLLDCVQEKALDLRRIAQVDRDLGMLARARRARPQGGAMRAADTMRNTVASRGSLETLDLAHPARQWVPTGENLGHPLVPE